MDNVKVYTFGCKVNTHDTSVIENKFRGLKFKEPLHIINTCAVTRKASLEALKLAKKIKKRSPGKVVITGCAAQVDTKEFENDYVDLIVANSDKDRLDYHIKNMFSDSPKTIKSNIFEKADIESNGGLVEGRTRAFLKIQDGCNSFCTFCVIPFARGKSRSLSIKSICDQINQLHSEGIMEVVLTGIHIGDYSSEGKKLEDLIESILKFTKMPRIRLSSLEPKELSNRLLEFYSDPRMCPHFHMSIQSLTNRILKKMRRTYDVKDIISSFDLIDKNIKDYFIGMDLIVGFVSETKSEFDESYNLLSNLPWTKIHVFPYSHRPYTRASKWDDTVSALEKKQRSKQMRELSTFRVNKKAKEQIGKTKKILVLKNQKGLSRDYWECKTFGRELSQAKEYTVQVKGYNPSIMMGKDGALITEMVS